jgi:hypothetical protein
VLPLSGLATSGLNAKEIQLSCNYCAGAPGGCAFPLRIDLDNSTVTEVCGPTCQRQYRATIGRDYIVWYTHAGWQRSLDRVSGDVRTQAPGHSFSGRCTEVHHRIGDD